MNDNQVEEEVKGDDAEEMLDEYNSGDDSESESAIETERSLFIIPPDSGPRISWDMTMFMFIIY